MRCTQILLTAAIVVAVAKVATVQAKFGVQIKSGESNEEISQKYVKRKNVNQGPPSPEEEKVWALFPAILEPVAPKAVSIPLSEEDLLLFHSSQRGLHEYVNSQLLEHQYDLTSEQQKAALRRKVSTNKQKVLEHVLEAILKGGMSNRQAQCGMAIAQWQAIEKISPDIYKEHMERAKKEMGKMPDKRKKMLETRLKKIHEAELKKIEKETPETTEQRLHDMYNPANLPEILQNEDVFMKCESSGSAGCCEKCIVSSRSKESLNNCLVQQCFPETNQGKNHAADKRQENVTKMLQVNNQTKKLKAEL